MFFDNFVSVALTRGVFLGSAPALASGVVRLVAAQVARRRHASQLWPDIRVDAALTEVGEVEQVGHSQLCQLFDEVDAFATEHVVAADREAQALDGCSMVDRVDVLGDSVGQRERWCEGGQLWPDILVDAAHVQATEAEEEGYGCLAQLFDGIDAFALEDEAGADREAQALDGCVVL